jgi:hypothetical protein
VVPEAGEGVDEEEEEPREDDEEGEHEEEGEHDAEGEEEEPVEGVEAPSRDDSYYEDLLEEELKRI